MRSKGGGRLDHVTLRNIVCPPSLRSKGGGRMNHVTPPGISSVPHPRFLSVTSAGAEGPKEGPAAYLAFR